MVQHLSVTKLNHISPIFWKVIVTHITSGMLQMFLISRWVLQNFEVVAAQSLGREEKLVHERFLYQNPIALQFRGRYIYFEII